MEIMRFQFTDLDQLVDVARKLRKMYDHICIYYNDKSLLLNVECTNSLIFDTRIISYVSKHGGMKLADC